MNFLIKLLSALLPGIIKELLNIKPTMAEGKSDGRTEKRLKKKIKKRWSKSKLPLIVFIIIFAGCGVKTVYVPEGDAVKLRETLKDVKVWVKPAKPAEPIAGKLTLYEGWY
jgi:hypothetical protein